MFLEHADKSKGLWSGSLLSVAVAAALLAHCVAEQAAAVAAALFPRRAIEFLGTAASTASATSASAAAGRAGSLGAGTSSSKRGNGGHTYSPQLFKHVLPHRVAGAIFNRRGEFAA